MSRGFLSGGLCPGGFCPGVFCPDTEKLERYWEDRVTTFWIKKFTCLHEKIAKAIIVMINENIHCPEWLPRGRTVMIPESKNPTAVSEFRPITCLNTIYKLITSVINSRILEHFLQNNKLQLDQRGGVIGSMDCTDNLSTDKTVLEDAIKF